MSNFAERLVARSAGASPAPGISPLALRPASRFEPTAGIEIDAIADTEPPVAAAAVTEAASPPRPAVAHTLIEARESPRSAGETRSAIAQPSDDGNRTPHDEANATSPVLRVEAPVVRAEAPETPLPDVVETQQGRAVPHPVASEISAMEDRAMMKVRASPDGTAAAPPRAHTREDVETFHVSPQPLPEQVSPPAASDRRLEIQTVRTERRVAAREFSIDRTPAPVISIGRIEVQFLPQEPRVPAARPQPERTRGFAAYTRARRGEPR
jgi:hypothetical protein